MSESDSEFLQLLETPVHSLRLVATQCPLARVTPADLFSNTEHVVPDEELATLVARLSAGSERTMFSRQILSQTQVPNIPFACRPSWQLSIPDESESESKLLKEW